jgi:hypothetical protein
MIHSSFMLDIGILFFRVRSRREGNGVIDGYICGSEVISNLTVHSHFHLSFVVPC